MKPRFQISIRYKILILLTLFPLLVLALYLGLAISVFKEDKIAYVFDSSSSVSRTLSSQISSHLETSIIQLKPSFQEFINTGEFGPLTDYLIRDDGNVNWISVFAAGLTSVDPTVLKKSERENGLFEESIKKLGQLNHVIDLALLNKRFIQTLGNQDILMAESVEVQDKKYVFLISIKLPEIFSNFEFPSATENYWIQENGEFIVGPSNNQMTHLNQIIPQAAFEEMKKSVSGSGVVTVNSITGEKQLLAYNKVGWAQTWIVSMISQNDALGAVQIILKKSIIFSLLVIAITVLISLFASRYLTRTIKELHYATREISQGNFDVRVTVNSNDELKVLADGFNFMTTEISRLIVATAEKARMESELSTARTVQETLFPRNEHRVLGLQISGRYEPASECGGDWWYYNQVGSKVYLWIGDATGHGAAAALITSAAKSAATLIENLNVGPSQVLQLLNQSIFEVSKGRIQMTFFVACFDPETATLTYSNASHDPPYLIPRTAEFLKKTDLVPLNEVNSPRLGESRSSRFLQSSVQLNPGDKVLFYTDGLVDLNNPAEIKWGERELLKAIFSSQKEGDSLDYLIEHIHRKSEFHRGGAPLKDDVTFFGVHYVPGDSM